MIIFNLIYCSRHPSAGHYNRDHCHVGIVIVLNLAAERHSGWYCRLVAVQVDKGVDDGAQAG